MSGSAERQDHVTIAVAVTRDREAGHVFAAAILSWDGGGDGKQVFLRELIPGTLPGAVDQEGYLNVAGGMASIAAKALDRLTRRCTVEMVTDVDTGEFLRFLEFASGARKATAKEARILESMRRTRGAFEMLVHAINGHARKGGFRAAMRADSDDVAAVRSYVTSYRDELPSHKAVPGMGSPAPAP